jgi:hypothetical protein
VEPMIPSYTKALRTTHPSVMLTFNKRTGARSPAVSNARAMSWFASPCGEYAHEISLTVFGDGRIVRMELKGLGPIRPCSSGITFGQVIAGRQHSSEMEFLLHSQSVAHHNPLRVKGLLFFVAGIRRLAIVLANKID